MLEIASALIPMQKPTPVGKSRIKPSVLKRENTASSSGVVMSRKGGLSWKLRGKLQGPPEFVKGVVDAIRRPACNGPASRGSHRDGRTVSVFNNMTSLS